MDAGKTWQKADFLGSLLPRPVLCTLQSPLINVWSNTDQLNQASPTHWTGAAQDFFAGVRVDGAFYVVMGSPSQPWGTLTPANQSSVTVYSTQTVYSFVAGGVSLNLSELAGMSKLRSSQPALLCSVYLTSHN